MSSRLRDSEMFRPLLSRVFITEDFFFLSSIPCPSRPVSFSTFQSCWNPKGRFYPGPCSSCTARYTCLTARATSKCRYSAPPKKKLTVLGGKWFCRLQKIASSIYHKHFEPEVKRWCAGGIDSLNFYAILPACWLQSSL